MFSDRKFEDAVLRDNHQEGSTMRLEPQFNEPDAVIDAAIRSSANSPPH